MPSNLQALSSSLDFGQAATGVVVGLTLSLHNYPDGFYPTDATISDVQFSRGSEYSTDVSLPLVIGVDSGGIINVYFTAGAAGVTPATDMIISSDDPSSPIVIPLTSEAIAPGVKAISGSPSSFDFGNTKVGASSAIQVFTLTNTGTVGVTIALPTLPFGFSAATPIPAWPVAVASGANVTFGVTFDPVDEGLEMGDISIASDAADSPLTISVSGTGFLITPAYLISGAENLVFAFGSTSAVSLMDPDDFSCEDPAYVSNTVMLPFQTSEGSVPGFGQEKEVTRIQFHYENLGVAVVRVSVICMGTGTVRSQDVTIGTVGATGELRQAMADIVNTDEVVSVKFAKLSGPVLIVDWVGRYVMKGEQKKEQL